MKTQDQLQREKASKLAARLAFAGVIAVVGAIFLLYSIACRPLPANLGELVVSPGALARLHKEVTGDH
jgi:hypothetical protein